MARAPSTRPFASSDVGRHSAWDQLCQVDTPVAISDMSTGIVDAMADVVSMCCDARENFTTRDRAAPYVRDVLFSLETHARTTVNEAERETLHIHLGILRGMEQATFASRPFQGPTAAARDLLDRIAAATRSTSRHATISQESVVTDGNVELGPMLHGGDEIWAAGAHLIEGAQTRIQLHTWALYKSSESAKHIGLALAKLQRRRAQEREAAVEQPPIKVEIITGCKYWGYGKEAATGGKASADATWLNAVQKNGGFRHAIFPFAIDPKVLDVSFAIRPHHFRGASHTKTLIVDGDVALFTSANVKGNHHVASENGTPFHDFGVVLAGPVVSTSMAEDFAHQRAHSRIRATNRGEPTQTLASINDTAAYAEKHLGPKPLSGRSGEILQDKLAILTKDLATYRNGRIPEDDKARFVSITKAAVDRPWTWGVTSPQQRGLLAAMNEAQELIEINNCNVNAKPVVKALKHALDRGVTVHVLASDGYADRYYKFKRRTNRNIYRELGKYACRKGRNPDGILRLRWHPGGHGVDLNYSASHTKAMFVDRDKVAIACTANLEKQSWDYSAEYNVATDAPHLVSDWRNSLFTAFWDDGVPHLDTSYECGETPAP